MPSKKQEPISRAYVTRGSLKRAMSQNQDDQIMGASENKVRRRKDRKKYSPDDFEFISTIGSGGFGYVCLVRSKCGGEKMFAMKVIRKGDIPDSPTDKRHLLAEHHALTKLTHPFMANVMCAFATKSKLIYIMEFLQGGELFTWLEKFDKFPRPVASYYLAEILMAVEYLHEKHIVFRDLKPENLMLDTQGHIKLIDFGLSKLDIDYEHKLTRTVCGTSVYMAPEVIRREEYGSAVDWWSFGVIAYDMLTGGPPFQGACKTDTYDEILTAPLHLPMALEVCEKHLLQGLLQRDPLQRLGHPRVGGTNALRSHPFFSDIKSWQDVYAKKIPPPIKPQIQDPEDLAHFDKLLLAKFERKGLNKRSPASSSNSHSDVDLKVDLDHGFEDFDYVNPNF